MVLLDGLAGPRSVLSIAFGQFATGELNRRERKGERWLSHRLMSVSRDGADRGRSLGIAEYDNLNRLHIILECTQSFTRPGSIYTRLLACARDAVASPRARDALELETDTGNKRTRNAGQRPMTRFNCAHGTRRPSCVWAGETTYTLLRGCRSRVSHSPPRDGLRAPREHWSPQRSPQRGKGRPG